MGNVPNDNRIGWIRNTERLSSAPSAPSYDFEYELGSECRIPGVLDYRSGMVLLGGLSIERDRRGLNHYLLKIKFPQMEDGNDSYKSANRKGYFFRDGVAGEIISLLSVYYRCRFYLLSTSFGDLTGSGSKIKDEHEFTYLPCNYQIHPQIFSGDHGNFAQGFADFQDSIESLDQKYHQQFILACHHYLRALKEVGVDTEMVFIRLVSSIETLSTPKTYLRKKKTSWQRFSRSEKQKLDLSNLSMNILLAIFEAETTRQGIQRLKRRICARH